MGSPRDKVSAGRMPKPDGAGYLFGRSSSEEVGQRGEHVGHLQPEHLNQAERHQRDEQNHHGVLHHGRPEVGRRSQKMSEILIAAGPSSTMNSAGKIHTTRGNRILTGSFNAVSSARWRRFILNSPA